MDAINDGKDNGSSRKRKSTSAGGNEPNPKKGNNALQPQDVASATPEYDLKSVNFDHVRQERRNTALMSVVNEIPALVKRVNEICVESTNYTEAKSLHSPCSGILSGPASASKRRSLDVRVDDTLIDATQLLKEVEDHDSKDEKVVTSLVKRAQVVRSDTLRVKRDYLVIRNGYTGTEQQNLESKLTKIRLFLHHPLFDNLEKYQSQTTAMPCDHIAHLCDQFGKCLECAHKVSEWIMLSERPDVMTTGANADIRLQAMEIAHELRSCCEESFSTLEDFEVKKTLLEDDCVEQPFSVKRLVLLDRHIDLNHVLWRIKGRSVVDLCVRLADFIRIHIDSLDKPGSDSSAASNMYL